MGPNRLTWLADFGVKAENDGVICETKISTREFTVRISKSSNKLSIRQTLRRVPLGRERFFGMRHRAGLLSHITASTMMRWVGCRSQEQTQHSKQQCDDQYGYRMGEQMDASEANEGAAKPLQWLT